MVRIREIVALCFLLSFNSASADQTYDCSVLDPRVELSSSTEGKVKATAETTLKIAKAEGEISGKVSSATQNIQKDFPLSEKANATNRFLYLFCEMMSKEKFSPDQKFEMYKILLNRFVPEEAGSSSGQQSSSVKSQSATKSASKVTIQKANPAVVPVSPTNQSTSMVSVSPPPQSNRDAFFAGKSISVNWSPRISKRVQPIRIILTLKNSKLIISSLYFKMTQSPELKEFYSIEKEPPRALIVFQIHDQGSLVATETYCCWRNIDFYPDFPTIFSFNDRTLIMDFPFNRLDVQKKITIYYDLIFARGDGVGNSASGKRFDADVNSDEIWRLLDSGTILN
ncbi:hypothetical protein [Pseudomonas putida]|uniref:Uncharacterized protein n=1 Tax=Pseudomonas putida TaxID=303 RepID=A0A6I7ETS9_PSEPU|nr:hypothetical protein [Pseudomonas putida]QHW08409.1 hypothetical protein C2H86_28630 [Pseudomonas putida]